MKKGASVSLTGRLCKQLFRFFGINKIQSEVVNKRGLGSFKGTFDAIQSARLLDTRDQRYRFDATITLGDIVISRAVVGLEMFRIKRQGKGTEESSELNCQQSMLSVAFAPLLFPLLHV